MNQPASEYKGFERRSKSPPSELSTTTRRNGVDKPAYLIARFNNLSGSPNKDSGSEGESSKAARKANKWP